MSTQPGTSTFAEKSVRASSAEWTPVLIRQAERSAGGGNLRNAAQLCDDILADDRVSGCLREVRIRGLLGLPVTFEPPMDAGDDTTITDALSEDWWSMVPEDVLTEWMEWGILLGVGFGHIKSWERVEQPSGTRMLPHRADGTVGFDVIHPSFARFDDEKQAWFVTGKDDKEVQITPGDGHWLVFAPYGSKRPWARGAWRSIARWWLLKNYALSDWGRYSERHGLGIMVGKAPEGARKEDRDLLAKELNQIGRETSAVLPPGYDFTLVESTANTWETFRAQLEAANVNNAVRILGQNLSTEVQGGSFAAAQIHQAVAASIIRADDETSATTLRTQLIEVWADLNFGARNKAPWPKRDTTPQADTAAFAKTLIDANAAFDAWRRSGAPLDVDGFARTFRVPLLDGEMWSEPEPYDDGGGFMFSRRRGRCGCGHNDVRLASGDNPSSASGAISGKRYVQQLIGNATQSTEPAMAPIIANVLRVMEDVEDAPGWHRRLRAALLKEFQVTDTAELESLLHKAIVMAELAGRTAVAQDVKRKR